MKKTTSYSFETSYKVRTSIALLVFRVILLEIMLVLISLAMTLIFYSGEGLDQSFAGSDIVVETSSYLYYQFFIFAVNFVIVIYVILRWYFKYFIISPHGISSNSGVIFRRTSSIDIPAIRSVNVRQGFFGKLFNFGTLMLETPLLKQEYYLENLPSPFKHAGLIEEARLEAITHEHSETIIPSA